jgi:hypothetical protein
MQTDDKETIKWNYIKTEGSMQDDNRETIKQN